MINKNTSRFHRFEGVLHLRHIWARSQPVDNWMKWQGKLLEVQELLSSVAKMLIPRHVRPSRGNL
jgi:hypothetical protein